MADQKVRKVLLYYNPKAGSGLFKTNLDKIIARFQKTGRTVLPLRADEYIQLDDVLQAVKLADFEKIVVAGGDGTINGMVNAMYRTDCDLPLAILPAGTANDFAHYFGIPTDLDGMLNIALGEHYTPADVGLCNDKYFVNVAAIGSVINIGQKTDVTMKNALGIFAYYFRALSELHTLKPTMVKVTTPDRVIEEKIYFMIVINGSSAGGFRRMGALSEINDGMLDVIMFKKMNLAYMAGTAVDVVQGRHADNENVIYFQTTELKIESDEAISTDIDGETGHPLPLDIRSIPGKLMINVSPSTEEEGKKSRRQRASGLLKNRRPEGAR